MAMVNIDEINGEIAKLESQPTTYVVLERLAWLYIVRDHITLNAEPMVKTNIVEKTVPCGDSDFMRLCAGKPIEQVMSVMDEAVETLSIIQPKLYSAVMGRLS